MSNYHYLDVVQSYAKIENKRLVVFIDDLDRCSPSGMLQVLDAIKAFVGISGVVYVLAIDPSLVHKAIQNKYPDDPNAQQDYLAKIVQLPFELPILSHNEIKKYADQLGKGMPDDACVQVLIEGLNPNPREIKRTINAFYLLHNIAKRREEDTIKPLCLLKVVVIQQAHRQLYDACREEPSILLELVKYYQEKQKYLETEESVNLEDRQVDQDVFNKILSDRLVRLSSQKVENLLAIKAKNDQSDSFTEMTVQDINAYFTLTKVINTQIIDNISLQQLVSIEDEPKVSFAEAFSKKIKTDKRKLDERFVQLTLWLDRGEEESERWQRQSVLQMEDLLKINQEDYPVMVILGAPGSGKSTLLRRLEVDYHRDQTSAGERGISFFAPLNRYRPFSRDKQPISPQQFLESVWNESYQETGLSLEDCLKQGKVLLLLDAINELPHGSKEEYHELLDYWREFAIAQMKRDNRVIFSCRSLDYSRSLSQPDLRVPNLELQSLTVGKIAEFLRAYLPEGHKEVLKEMAKDGTMNFYNNPFFLSLLCEQIGYTKEVPKGRASLFTAFVRNAMKREMDTPLFEIENLFSNHDRRKLILNNWVSPFQLPMDGALAERLSYLAYEMKRIGQHGEANQISIDLDKAIDLIGDDKAEKLYAGMIIQAGNAINVLNLDVRKDELTYHHQLLQEYFAGRWLALDPKPELVSVEWRASEVRPSLAETIAGLANGDQLPPPGQTGWEETTLLALPMSGDPEGYLARLIEYNLPLAARCAISPEVKISEETKALIREKLVNRTQDMTADLRARIAAGEALGLIGDPRLKPYRSAEGECLLPLMADIPAGVYPIGDDHSGFDDERPAHKVELPTYQIGVYPVTNAEYAKFIEAGGYEDERWWDTAAAQRWRREGGSEDQKQSFRNERWRLQNNWTDDQIKSMVSQGRATEEQVEGILWIRNASEEEFERQIDEWFPAGIFYRTPRYWEDATYNNPAQPVVGVCWYEARAYCNWLSWGTRGGYRLPSEVEFEAAARGAKGRLFSYGNMFDSSRCNTFESHIRRPTPIGIFDNRTPEGAYDLTGNVWTWTSTIYDQAKYRYPYNSSDGRELAETASGSEEGSSTEKRARDSDRVLRGGVWNRDASLCRSACRHRNVPGYRDNNLGFRLSRTLP